MVLSIAGDSALDAACAIEMIHTYTLIHDDLPAMDDDDYRRGQKSLHIKEGEATAILTGDFLLTYAFELLSPYPQVVRVVAQKLGASGVLAGQVKDLEAKNRPITLEQYLDIARKKTGALFAAACLTGALLKNPSPDSLDLYEIFGESFGIYFQIQDDLKDAVELSSIQSIVDSKSLKKLQAQYLNECRDLLKFFDDSSLYLSELLF